MRDAYFSFCRSAKMAFLPILALLISGVTLPVLAESGTTSANQAFPVTFKRQAKVNPGNVSSVGDSTYAYVSRVFDKLQSHWEEQAFANQSGDNTLAFTLDETGALRSSKLDTENTSASGQAVLAYLRKNAPFGPFPRAIQGNELEFKFKLSPDSLQMVSYQQVPAKNRDSIVTFASAVPNQPQPIALYYTRVAAPGKVWDKPAKANDSQQAMDNYVAQVQQQVRDNWKLPQDYVFQRAIAELMIDRDGTLLGASLKQSSGDKTVDKAALEAIYTAGKFPQAPADVPSLPITIEYIFDPVLSEAQ